MRMKMHKHLLDNSMLANGQLGLGSIRHLWSQLNTPEAKKGVHKYEEGNLWKIRRSRNMEWRTTG
ncbi:UNVERIFIED_CONTAM: hypothetical protein Sradi_3614400 [Sesamum radiatum]|uniref:Uncharacterized protein n=1 Tax=Sesamum radiatum TaxID=300843 RepID=A0AAW2QHF7_SESRA